MTSQRTRERLIQRLKDQGITNQRILDVFRVTPRHIFLDEALAHRAYEDTARRTTKTMINQRMRAFYSLFGYLPINCYALFLEISQERNSQQAIMPTPRITERL
ncbi:hypothetical protein N9P80_01405 [Porticoccaceae bacterium]|nr:hypothetical protein [Porticoccaceae bacterium]